MSAVHNTTLHIYASGDHYHDVAEPLPDLKALTQATTGRAMRRIGRFIQLAMIGAARCAQANSIPSSTAVYFSSARGDLELTVDIMTQLFRDGQTPKPLGFVNTVSNAACFYVAQLLALKSQSNFVCNRYFAFESVLQLAALDLSLGKVDSALVGSLDIATAPLSEHRQRLQLSSDTIMGEGSHWLWLGTVRTDRPRIGELLEVRHFTDRESLLTWAQQHAFSTNHCALSRGQFLSDHDFKTIQSSTGVTAHFEYRANRAYYDSHSGAVISEFLRSDAAATELLHINSDVDGRYSVLVVKR